MFKLETKAQGDLTCDADGVRLGADCLLIAPEPLSRVYRARGRPELEGLLAAAYGSDLDLDRACKRLAQAAELMGAGQLGLAQINILQLTLPPLTAAGLDRLRKADALLKFNANHRPAGPGGGEFASSDDDGGGGASPTPVEPRQDRAALIAAQDAARKKPAYRPRPGATFCNYALFDIAKALGAPMAPLTQPNGKPVDANTMAANLARSPNYRSVNPDQAQALADHGQLVIVAWVNPSGPHGHVATVRPSNVPGDKPTGAHGPLLSNVGLSNVVMHQSMAFRAGLDVRYYTPK